MEDETGPCNGVKGAVDACDPPLEARVPRLDRCCLKQKVGYSRDTAPKNEPGRPLLCRESVETCPSFRREDSLSGTDCERDRRFRAESGLEWLSDLPALSSDSRTIFRRDLAVGPDSRSGLIMSDSLGLGRRIEVFHRYNSHGRTCNTSPKEQH
jgi:hypothetical protein